jgi:hypothetical protein
MPIGDHAAMFPRRVLTLPFVWLALFAAACGDSTVTSAAPPGAPSGEFAVLAYNVAGLPQGISSSNPKRNLPLISPLLNAYDIVFTQEDFDWWVPVLDTSDFANYHTRLRS